ncbi:LacI family DNA-binding transcriptional regulator [Salinarimonas ramus]|uniref:LacI family transcriptional regulator n=1 Tax=Salinarimonas ramus TaxID=690164 RepID=A0A917QB56_9HYPH|nr:LacI family DNA-binding transcriptional regulator [Salinarimonas ramus]GGK40303.1 LacI family transcriptional regulator [Salinarimonas ramus]
MDESAPTTQSGVPARITDVARLAGVSTATVSRVLAKPDQVAPRTRARVQEAVARLGYVPNPAARTLRSQKTRMVLVVVPDLENVFFSRILRGIEETLAAAGHGMIIADLDPASPRMEELAAFARRQVDGVILLNGRRLGTEAEGVPTIALCETIPGVSFPQIAVDNRASARRVVAHLASLGHRRIAYLAGPEGNVLEVERAAGYREGLAAAGLAFDPALVWPGDYTLASGVAAAGRLLADGARPTAVFASSDVMAIGLVGALQEAGLDVPGDVSVAGFDDIEFAAMSRPALTTIRQPRRDLGRAAAEALLARLAGRTPPALSLLETELVVRASTGPVGPRAR